MKPQEKVVTAQDIQSSLYYLHLASPNDHELLRGDEECDEEQEIEIWRPHPPFSNKASFRRKAVHSNAYDSSSSHSDVPPLVSLHSQNCTDSMNMNPQIRRKPVDGGRRLEHKSEDLAPRLPPRKLLGPRTMNQRLHSVDSSMQHSIPRRQDINMRRWSEQPHVKPPQLPPRPSLVDDDTNVFLSPQRRDKVTSSNYQVDGSKDIEIPPEHYWKWERLWEENRANESRAEMAEVASAVRTSQEKLQDLSSRSQDASLSLIRRYGGEQWNVAQIGLTGQEQSFDNARDIKSMISIDILTPGYSKFIARNKMGGASSLVQKLDKDKNMIDNEKTAFRLQMQVCRESDFPSNSQFSESIKGPTSNFHGLEQNTASPRASSDDSSVHRSASSGGYSIQTPWNGICEFTTGIAGRSLKCKHSYISSNPKDGSEVFSGPVSELRFNLPSSKAFGRPNAKSSTPGLPREGKRSSISTQSSHRYTSSSLVEASAIKSNGHVGAKVELEERLDLSLGQEHAGGGFGGKQAKLGKLIVEAEGLQMLDLIVAANMALWWKVYEKMT